MELSNQFKLLMSMYVPTVGENSIEINMGLLNACISTSIEIVHLLSWLITLPFSMLERCYFIVRLIDIFSPSSLKSVNNWITDPSSEWLAVYWKFLNVIFQCFYFVFSFLNLICFAFNQSCTGFEQNFVVFFNKWHLKTWFCFMCDWPLWHVYWKVTFQFIFLYSSCTDCEC